MKSLPGKRREGGATAVEYALVFPVFFLLFYGILSYGLIFLLRLGLQHAAEDGVRAALRVQQITYANGSTGPQRRQAQLQARLTWAKSVAATQASWMNGWQTPTILANVCLTNVECQPSAAAIAFPDCDSDTSCQIVITVTYLYKAAPVMPPVPGLGPLIPDSLQGRARALLDGRALPT